jgi:cbb3-type cytochrome oxidase cytochrome c subunit
MAASDKPFHNQRTLDIVYAVSNILMLLSVIWMFVQDYNREYKTEQRAFREVEVAIAQRTALESIPSAKEFDDARDLVQDLKTKRDEKKDALASARAAMIGYRPDKEKAEAHFQTVKADVESFTSLLSIAIEHGDDKLKKKYEDLLVDRNDKLAKAQADRDSIASKMKAEQIKIDDIEGKLTKAVAAFKKVNDRVDAQVKLAINKRWGFGDWLRTQPVINGFADPLKIYQFTINDIPIDYNFKQVTRYDRCMSCHLGIDRPSFTRENLVALTKDDSSKEKLDEAIAMYKKRMEVLDDKDKGVIPNPESLRPGKLLDQVLTASRITEFCAHPRLELFVGSASKHPAEKFGCSSCHSGQGSGTSFTDSSHSPNSMAMKKAWSHDRGWEFNHQWDFPMLPTRFVESSCLKCHHEVTDLISSDNRNEAPKLLRGHTLIRENGCFGCHEISGYKAGNRVGPDMRLEPSPPLDDLNPIERNRVLTDPDNRPGNLRKVGPSLARVTQKVNADWIEKWLRSPSAFRPDTKMPHYYGLSTNDKSVLPKDQESFPDTEMASIAYFLTKNSKDYLDDAAAIRQKDAKDPQASQKDQQLLVELLNKGRLDEKDKDEFDAVKKRIQLRKEVPLEDLTPQGYKPDKEKGRVLFTEKGCLACHTHKGTEEKESYAPAIASEAVFGPNLSQVAEKFGDKAAGRKWLIQWILNPQVHSPRSRMPVTHLSPSDAADIAAWLLDQSYVREQNDPWLKIDVKQPSNADLKDLARVYLTRMLSKSDMEKYLNGEFKATEWEIVKSDVTKDEVKLKDHVNDDNQMKFYLGKKAVSRLGCFGCHDIPGFESVKSIGVGLLDWGKKPADRLAFEDIDNFYKSHYFTVDSLTDKDGKPIGVKEDGKEPYESFYTDALTGHHRQRDGYLNQKIRDPRSYDYNRIRAWDDRARMPKFTLARPRKKADEKDDDFKARNFKDEAEAREAVATFVLGLVAEAVPLRSINQPTGDRLAEVKGRQILDKYNCAGCHVNRAGVYDFKAGLGSKSLELLDTKYHDVREGMAKSGEYDQLNHHKWVGRNPLGTDRLTGYGVQPTYEEGELLLNLSEAIRFVGKDKAVKNIPAGVNVRIAGDDLTLDPASIKSQADFNRQFQAVAPFGGAFPELMVPWLSKKYPSKYPFVGGDSKEARASLPPSLIGQGERTQPDWLYQFLLDPQQVRRMIVLRMPKFNMSKEEAKVLVDYFAAITRQTNPGIGLSYPHEMIAARSELSTEYWHNKTKQYIEQLKNTKETEKDGKPKANARTLYQARIDAYTPLWERMLKNSLQDLEDLIKDKTVAKEAKLKAVMDEKDATKKGELEKEVEALNVLLKSKAEEKTQAEKALANKDVSTQRKIWETEEAYASDAYRMLMSRELCTKCHQIGSVVSSEPNKQGPPLDLAAQRLRPEWIERWVNQPQRYLAYPSIMPPYFDRTKMQYQNLHAGQAHEQIQALRDALMNYPRLSNLPINRMFDPDLPAGK